MSTLKCKQKFYSLVDTRNKKVLCSEVHAIKIGLFKIVFDLSNQTKLVQTYLAQTVLVVLFELNNFIENILYNLLIKCFYASLRFVSEKIKLKISL